MHVSYNQAKEPSEIKENIRRRTLELLELESLRKRYRQCIDNGWSLRNFNAGYPFVWAGQEALDVPLQEYVTFEKMLDEDAVLISRCEMLRKIGLNPALSLQPEYGGVLLALYIQVDESGDIALTGPSEQRPPLPSG